MIQHGTFLAGPSQTWLSARGGCAQAHQETLGTVLPGAWGRAPSIRNARQGSRDSSPASGQDTEEDGSLLLSIQTVHPVPVRVRLGAGEPHLHRKRIRHFCQKTLERQELMDPIQPCRFRSLNEFKDFSFFP